LLANGKVLAAGGMDDNGMTLASAELYDPTHGSWRPASPMAMARYLHTATLLNYGPVLVAGGGEDIDILAGAELYDPSSNSWKPAGPLAAARYYAGATLLANGKVLVSGGTDANG